jgi:capsular polysaccharide biosynthesis protein
VERIRSALSSSLIKIFKFLFRSGILEFKNYEIIEEFDKRTYPHLYNPDYTEIINIHYFDKNFLCFLSGTYTFENKLFKLQGAFIESASGGVIVDHQILKQSVLNSSGYVSKAGIFKYLLFRKSKLRKVKYIPEGFLLTNIMGYNYFHFLIDSFPRILDFRLIMKTYPDLKLLLNHKTSFAESYLELLGIPKNRIEWLNSNSWVEKLFFSNYKHVPSNPKMDWTRFVYDKMALLNLSSILIRKSQKMAGKSQFPRRIFISRRKAGTRTVVNEKDVIEFLSKFNFKPVCLEELEAWQQVHMIANADFIVAPHGAGLANLIYADNAVILEFFPKIKKLTTLYQMHQLGQVGENEHVLIMCEKTSPKEDVEIDISLLSSLLDKYLTLKSH